MIERHPLPLSCCWSSRKGWIKWAHLLFCFCLRFLGVCSAPLGWHLASFISCSLPVLCRSPIDEAPRVVTAVACFREELLRSLPCQNIPLWGWGASAREHALVKGRRGPGWKQPLVLQSNESRKGPTGVRLPSQQEPPKDGAREESSSVAEGGMAERLSALTFVSPHCGSLSPSSEAGSLPEKGIPIPRAPSIFPKVQQQLCRLHSILGCEPVIIPRKTGSRTEAGSPQPITLMATKPPPRLDPKSQAG